MVYKDTAEIPEKCSTASDAITMLCQNIKPVGVHKRRMAVICSFFNSVDTILQLQYTKSL